MAPEQAGEASPAPTFEGRIKLQEFSFDGTAGGPRRSKRRATSEADEAAPSSSKRKATKQKATTTTTSGAAERPNPYAHLSLLPDAVGPGLLVFFVGLNPGVETARQQHAYAHPSNWFWRLLASSGVTPRLCAPAEDQDMPRLYSLGLTNIVARPSRSGSELSKGEMDTGVAVLEEKMRRWRPETVCIVGKGIWESIWRVRHGGRAIRRDEFHYGWQDESENMGVVGPEGQAAHEREDGIEYGDGAWAGARVFVGTSTSGLAASLSPAEKQAIWRELGEWVERRREERAAAGTPSAST